MMCGRHNALRIATEGFFLACRQCLLLAVGERAMHGVLGEKIGEGVFADIHAWAPGQVVKLFKGGIPRRVSRWEARMTSAVFAAGGPAPEVLGEVCLDGRCGIVLPRLKGPTLLQLTKSGAITFERASAILASLFLAVHNTPPPPDVLPLRDLINGSSLLSGGAVPRHIATGILALIERLRPGDGLCHGDLLVRELSTGALRPARPPPSTLRGATSRCRRSPCRSQTIRSGRAPSMQPRSPNTHGWPGRPRPR
jgi:hypothetical protein